MQWSLLNSYCRSITAFTGPRTYPLGDVGRSAGLLLRAKAGVPATARRLGLPRTYLASACWRVDSATKRRAWFRSRSRQLRRATSETLTNTVMMRATAIALTSKHMGVIELGSGRRGRHSFGGRGNLAFYRHSIAAEATPAPGPLIFTSASCLSNDVGIASE